MYFVIDLLKLEAYKKVPGEILTNEAISTIAKATCL